MKKNIAIYASLLLFLLLTLSSGLRAQDIMKVGTGLNNKVLLDNDQVRVIEIESAPGVETTWHSHPNHVVYALSDGKLEITDKGKPAKVYEFKAGQAVYFPATTHMAKNVGTTSLKLIMTEIKPVEKK